MYEYKLCLSDCEFVNVCESVVCLVCVSQSGGILR